jgi:hypothetical protein
LGGGNRASANKQTPSWCGIGRASDASATEAGKRGSVSGRTEGVPFCGGRTQASEASAKQACPSGAHSGERATRARRGVSFGTGSGQARERERSGRTEGVSFCGGSRRAKRARRRRALLRQNQARSTKRRSGATLRQKQARSKKACASAAEAGSRKEGVPFYGGSGLLCSEVVGGRPSEPPLRPARSHMPPPMCSAAHAPSHVLGRP